MAARKTPGTAVIDYDEELARAAKVAAAMEAHTGGGLFFSTKSGVLSIGGEPLDNNEMVVVILDAVIENAYYPGEYAPDQARPPKCFAFGRDDATLAPHEITTNANNAESDLCSSCPMNQYGSADTGRGKACKNTRRLALIPAGTVTKGKFTEFKRASEFADSEIAFLKIPPTSLKAYAAFVKSASNALQRPPHGLYTKINLVPDAQNQFAIHFEPVKKTPNEFMPVIMDRREEAVLSIVTPYEPYDAAKFEAPPAKGRASKTVGRQAAESPAKTTKRY